MKAIVVTDQAAGTAGKVASLDDAVAAFNPTERIKGKAIIRVDPLSDTCHLGSAAVNRDSDRAGNVSFHYLRVDLTPRMTCKRALTRACPQHRCEVSMPELVASVLQEMTT